MLRLCVKKRRDEERGNISTWQKKATQQACGTKQSNRWHKTKAKLEGYKMTKKTKNWTTVKLSAMGILTKKPKNWTVVKFSAMGILVYSTYFSFSI